MIVNKKYAISNHKTFDIPPIRDFLKRNMKDCKVIVDPFSNTSKIATVTNDLNLEYDTDFHLDALDFLKMFDDESVDCVLYDPPYSPRQVSEMYKGFGKKVTQEMTQSSWRSKHLNEIKRILKPGGKAFCFGWNSNGVGLCRGFEPQEILLVAHGGSKHDTICTFEIKKEY